MYYCLTDSAPYSWHMDLVNVSTLLQRLPVVQWFFSILYFDLVSCTTELLSYMIYYSISCDCLFVNIMGVDM